jgi:hypothetical protein
MIRSFSLAAALAASSLGLVGQAQAQTTPAIPPLVTVTLTNVANNIAVNLNIDRANVPVTIQLPLQLAANVCGVSVSVLAASAGGQAKCTATSAPQQLTQAVQQQMAAGGSVGGGSQNLNVGGGSGTSSGGASGTGATSSGSTVGGPQGTSATTPH